MKGCKELHDTGCKRFGRVPARIQDISKERERVKNKRWKKIKSLIYTNKNRKFS